jgi:hypothetical protein
MNDLSPVGQALTASFKKIYVANIGDLSESRRICVMRRLLRYNGENTSIAYISVDEYDNVWISLPGSISAQSVEKQVKDLIIECNS